MTQAERVLAHLKAGRTITSLQAIMAYGIIQLPRRIYDLKRAGYPIVKRMVGRVNRYGDWVRVAEYRLDVSRTT